jgi:hypothetical protein
VRAGAGRGRDVEDDIDGPTRARFLLEWFKRRPTDSVAAIIAAIATITIVVNALFLQSGPHPAPIFANKPHPVADVKPGTIVPRPRPAEISARPEIVADIQRELAKRGFYCEARLLRWRCGWGLWSEDRRRHPGFRADRRPAALGPAK